MGPEDETHDTVMCVSLGHWRRGQGDSVVGMICAKEKRKGSHERHVCIRGILGRVLNRFQPTTRQAHPHKRRRRLEAVLIYIHPLLPALPELGRMQVRSQVTRKLFWNSFVRRLRGHRFAIFSSLLPPSC